MAALTPAHAAENGGVNLKGGAFTYGAALFPAPGDTAFMGYFAWLQSTSLHDDSGNNVHVPGGVTVGAFGHAGRLMHTWDVEWHGFHLTSSATYLVTYAHLRQGSRHFESADLSNLDIEPFLITKTIGNLHMVVGVNAWFPVGEYRPNDPANAAAHVHYISIIPEYGITWKPIPKLQIDYDGYMQIDFRNRRTGYYSGNTVAQELGITGWPFKALPRLGVGVGAYYLQQLQNDTDDGRDGKIATIVNGNKLQRIAFGPQIVYTFPSHLSLLFKWQHDFRSRNTADGDLFWIMFYLPIAL